MFYLQFNFFCWLNLKCIPIQTNYLVLRELKFFFTLVIYGEMTSFRGPKFSSSLLQCNLLNLSKKLSGNFTVANERLVLSVYIIWKGNISPLKVSANVSVIACLSSAPCFGTWNFFLPWCHWKFAHILMVTDQHLL